MLSGLYPVMEMEVRCMNYVIEENAGGKAQFFDDTCAQMFSDGWGFWGALTSSLGEDGKEHLARILTVFAAWCLLTGLGCFHAGVW